MDGEVRSLPCEGEPERMRFASREDSCGRTHQDDSERSHGRRANGAVRDGASVEHISSCRYELVCSTKSGRTLSAAGIRISALKVKPRKRRDPQESPALRNALNDGPAARGASTLRRQGGSIRKSAQLPETPLTVRNLAEGATVADRPSWRSPGP